MAKTNNENVKSKIWFTVKVTGKNVTYSNSARVDEGDVDTAEKEIKTLIEELDPDYENVAKMLSAYAVRGNATTAKKRIYIGDKFDIFVFKTKDRSDKT